jgi:acyl-CoA thioester hydrolase
MADIEFKITKRTGKQAEGTLIWGAKALTSAAISGPYGKGFLPNGLYVARRSKLLDKEDDAYKDKKGHCWMQAFDDAHGRSELGIHPDGNVPGTEGCIGLKVDDTKPWYDALYAVSGHVTVEVKNVAAVTGVAPSLLTSIAWPVAWGDMDAYQHVNNAVFMRWLENARIAWLDEVKFPESESTPRRGPVVRTASLEFLRPVTYPDQVAISVRAQSIGTTSVTLAYEITSERQDGALVATASTRVVLVDFDHEKSVPLSHDARERILAHDPQATQS